MSFEGYVPTSLGFDLRYDENKTTYHLDIPMNPITSSTDNILQNIYFDLNSANLRSESSVELKNLANFLQKKPTIKIQLGGHTDTRGNADENLKLSTARAKTVYNYLIEVEQIDPSRLSFVGFGETQPLLSDAEINKLTSDAEKEKAHQKNRRTVYRIIN